MGLRHTHFYRSSHIRLILHTGEQITGQYRRTGRRGIELLDGQCVPTRLIRAANYDKQHGTFVAHTKGTRDAIDTAAA